MPHANIHSDEETEKLEAATAFTRADLACTFGPSFFLGHHTAVSAVLMAGGDAAARSTVHISISCSLPCGA